MQGAIVPLTLSLYEGFGFTYCRGNGERNSGGINFKLLVDARGRRGAAILVDPHMS